MHSIKNKRILSTILVSFFAIFAVAFPVFAQSTMGWTATIFSSLAQIIIELVGKLLIVLIEILIAIVKYNDFINADAVQRGWILVRDISNMAFLIIFIAIAFATILGVEKYEWKRLLPKLLIMSVAINFSKTICGIIIDASQVIMMTFVNGFKDIAAGNLIRGFGLNDMLAIRDLGVDENITDNSIAAASVLAVILLIIAAMTLGVIVLMFLIRIVYLWILIVLSPLAFMLAAAPGADAQFQKWFQQFIRYAFIGPILAFFLWLSFSVMAGVDPGSNLAQKNHIPFTDQPTGFMEPAGNTAAAISGISRSDNLLSYFIAIALLLLSLTVANSIGTAGSSLAGNAMAKIKSGGVKLGKLTALAAVTGGAGVPGLVATKFQRNKLDDTVVKWGTKIPSMGIKTALDKTIGRSETGKRLLGKTFLYKGISAVAKSGLKIRTIPKAWKDVRDQKEKERTAEYYGTAKDLLNGVMYNEDSNYATREVTRLVAEEMEDLKKTSGMSTAILNHYEANGSKIQQMAAQNLLEEKTSFGSLVMKEDIHKAVLTSYRRGVEKSEKEHNKLLNKLTKLTPGTREYAEIKKQSDDLQYAIDRSKTEIQEMEQYTVMDTPAHRLEYVKQKFGNSPQTHAFYSNLTGIARQNGEAHLHGSESYDGDTKRYVPVDFSSPSGRDKQMTSMAARAAFMQFSEIAKVDTSVFRDKVKKIGSDQEELSDITSSGKMFLNQMAGQITDRSVGQINQATFAGILGGDVLDFREKILKAKDPAEIDAIKATFKDKLGQGLIELSRLNILGNEDIAALNKRLKNFIK